MPTSGQNHLPPKILYWSDNSWSERQEHDLNECIPERLFCTCYRRLPYLPSHPQSRYTHPYIHTHSADIDKQTQAAPGTLQRVRTSTYAHTTLNQGTKGTHWNNTSVIWRCGSLLVRVPATRSPVPGSYLGPGGFPTVFSERRQITLLYGINNVLNILGLSGL